jgi:membrane protease subunit (stomatin/prohibitin family)
VCWNEGRQQCLNCAPDLAREAASAQAHIAAQQLTDKMRQVDQTGGVDPSAQMVGACPACHAPLAAGAKFCAGCGKPVGSGVAKAFCSGCGASLAGGAKFCSGCGQAAGV